MYRETFRRGERFRLDWLRRSKREGPVPPNGRHDGTRPLRHRRRGLALLFARRFVGGIFPAVQEVNCPEGARETTLGCAAGKNDPASFRRHRRRKPGRGPGPFLDFSRGRARTLRCAPGTGDGSPWSAALFCWKHLLPGSPRSGIAGAKWQEWSRDRFGKLIDYAGKAKGGDGDAGAGLGGAADAGSPGGAPGAGAHSGGSGPGIPVLALVFLPPLPGVHGPHACGLPAAAAAVPLGPAAEGGRLPGHRRGHGAGLRQRGRLHPGLPAGLRRDPGGVRTEPRAHPPLCPLRREIPGTAKGDDFYEGYPERIHPDGAQARPQGHCEAGRGGRGVLRLLRRGGL